MKCLLIHDTTIVENAPGRFYCLGNFGKPVIERYLKVFTKLCIIGRNHPLDSSSQKKLTPIDSKNVVVKILPDINTPINFIKHFLLAEKLIKQMILESDCVIIRMPSRYGLIGAFELLNLKKPWMIELVGCAWDGHWNFGTTAGKVAAPFMFLFTKYVVSRAKYVVYVTEEFLQRRYPTNGKMVACSNVNISIPKPDVIEKRIVRINNLYLRSEVKIGMIGALAVDYKGHKTAIKAIKLVKEKFPKVALYILGSGDPDQLKHFSAELGVEENVTFCGSLPSGDPVLNWMDSLDIFISPSKQEGLPRAIIEAMSRGCPVVGSTAGGIPELINVLHSPKDHTSLAKLILRLLSDKEYMKEQAVRNFYRAQEYDCEKLTRKRTEFLETFASSISIKK